MADDDFDDCEPAVAIESLPVGTEFRDEEGRVLVATDANNVVVWTTNPAGNGPSIEHGTLVRPLLVQHVTVRADELAALRKEVGRFAELVGCGDNGCLFERSRGMATNGGCQCLETLREPGVRPRIAALYRAAREVIDG